MKADLKDRLKSAIQKAIDKRQDDFMGTDIAHDVINANPILWGEASGFLAWESLVKIVAGVLRGFSKTNPGQLFLEGFEDLPRYIRVKGRILDIRDATAEQLKEFTKWYESCPKMKRALRQLKILDALQRLTRLVIRYDKKTPGISVWRVLEIRETRREARAELNRKN